MWNWYSFGFLSSNHWVAKAKFQAWALSISLEKNFHYSATLLFVCFTNNIIIVQVQHKYEYEYEYVLPYPTILHTVNKKKGISPVRTVC